VAVPIGVFQAAVRDRFAAAGGMDEAVVADVEANVGDLRGGDLEEEDVAGADLRQRHPVDPVEQPLGRVGDIDSDASVGVTHQAAAIEPLRTFAAPTVGDANLLLGRLHHRGDGIAPCRAVAAAAADELHGDGDQQQPAPMA